MNQQSKPIKKTLVGTVISDKMDKTVTVQIEKHKRHPMYKKFVKSFVKVKAHDEKNEASEGDLVKLVSTRPISKEKKWRLIKILAKARKEGISHDINA
ncbi:MAG: 30S ribosomal protein S17 [Candidatus Omnitrophica bacterium]|nr:30S ribosomal protein S17 [Candidatus Omnitrophota bacterium]